MLKQATTQYSPTEVGGLLPDVDSYFDATGSVMPPFNSENSTSFLKIAQNGIVAIIAISVPTAIAEVIEQDPTVDTVIEQPSYYTYSSITSISEKLEEMFQLVNQNEISSFMKSHSELYDALEFVSNQVRQYTDVKAVSLEHYSDVEEGWEKLYLLIETTLDDMDALDSLEDKIFFEALDPISSLTKGKLVLTVS
ncbi:hypothetical protein [Sessilibacter corallicola]|uniref:Uncharacterized protein n=1 Tax=Sessilibacter corallicola TaxID=2904075 RepID=A0ABQ0A8B5_9GAMM